MKKILITVLLTIVSGLAYAQSPGSFRAKETHGLGFGVEGPGAAIFYDYAINDTFQAHIFGSAMARSVSSVLGTDAITTGSLLLGVTIRMFPADTTGFFIGLGGGATTGTQTVNQDVYCSSIHTSGNPIECRGFEGTSIQKETKSTYTAGSTWISVGWQGYEGYYFTIGIMAGSDFAINEKDNTDQVIDTANHKSTTQDEWEFAKRGPSGLIISFAWHF